MRKLFLGGNDYYLRRYIQDVNGSPALGLALTGWLSATKGGDEIHVDLKKSLAEGDTVTHQGGSYREYKAPLDPDKMVEHLTPFAGKVIWDRSHGSNYDDSEPVLVVLVRPAGEG